MKKFCCYLIPCLLLVCLLFSGCENTPEPSDTPVTQSTTTSIKTDDSVWYSEEADVRGRIWLGMTEKEVYDVFLNNLKSLKKEFDFWHSVCYDDLKEKFEYENLNPTIAS